jgi:hypothetical protein
MSHGLNTQAVFFAYEGLRRAEFFKRLAVPVKRP